MPAYSTKEMALAVCEWERRLQVAHLFSSVKQEHTTYSYGKVKVPRPQATLAVAENRVPTLPG